MVSLSGKGNMKCFRTLIAPAAISLLLSTATADADVEELYHWCKSSFGSTLQSFCLGYVGGIGDMMHFFWEHGGAEHRFAICDRPSHIEMVTAFINWAERNPGEWGRDETAGVATALVEIYSSCPTK
jgi:hypothetical protein